MTFDIHGKRTGRKRRSVSNRHPTERTPWRRHFISQEAPSARSDLLSSPLPYPNIKQRLVRWRKRKNRIDSEATRIIKITMCKSICNSGRANHLYPPPSLHWSQLHRSCIAQFLLRQPQSQEENSRTSLHGTWAQRYTHNQGVWHRYWQRFSLLHHSNRWTRIVYCLPTDQKNLHSIHPTTPYHTTHAIHTQYNNNTTQQFNNSFISFFLSSLLAYSFIVSADRYRYTYIALE